LLILEEWLFVSLIEGSNSMRKCEGLVQLSVNRNDGSISIKCNK